ncbi:hypothetical protein H1P_350007 [Hyella patelloides LEGE 07179]|uniref:Uncharacterized protein n=1 Tax=Hyella patelloides LEGE 07179 TaxID=945734 RepID=A0A563VW02_9CYAN|nr:hypothetical protein H1P_350007 [Hyella patelloides LEGE 07179]
MVIRFFPSPSIFKEGKPDQSSPKHQLKNKRAEIAITNQLKELILSIRLKGKNTKRSESSQLPNSSKNIITKIDIFR